MLTLVLLFLPLVLGLGVLALPSRSAPSAALGVAIIELIVTVMVWNVFQTQGGEGLEVNYPWIDRPKIHFHLAIDGLGLLMIALTNVLTPLIILSGFNRSIPSASSYFSLILLMQSALLGVFMAVDGLVYYIFWELALIPIYFIALRWGGPNRTGVTLKFFLYTLAGSLLMLFGMIMLSTMAPDKSFNILDWYQMNISPEIQSWLFWLFFLAFAVKIPIVPFHTWQVDTYREAPTQGTMLLSGIMLKMGLFSLLRWLLPVVPLGVAKWGPLAITLCVIGIVYASVIAIRQRNIKNLLAYSSLAHVGLIAAGIFALNQVGGEGSVLQMIAHGINVVGLFFCADIIMNRTGSNNLDNLGGIRQQAPAFATLFMIILLGSVALPLTNGFVGEFMLLYGVYSYNTWLAVFAGLTVVLGAVYMLRMYKHAMLGNTGARVETFTDLQWNEKVVLGVIAVLVIVMGVYPQPILDVAAPAVAEILKLSIQ